MSQRFQPKPQRKLASFALEDETIAEKDVARKIGIVSWYVWQYLLKQSARGPKEIADAVNLKRDSVRRALKVLKHDNVGLATYIEGVYYGEPKTDDSLALMAAFWHDGASPAKNRKASHKLEREIRATKLVAGAITAWEKKQAAPGRISLLTADQRAVGEEKSE